MIKITEEFIKKLEIYKEINLHSNMGWTVTPGDQEQSTAAGLEFIGKQPFELHLEKPAPGCYQRHTSWENVYMGLHRGKDHRERNIDVSAYSAYSAAG